MEFERNLGATIDSMFPLNICKETGIVNSRFNFAYRFIIYYIKCYQMVQCFSLEM